MQALLLHCGLVQFRRNSGHSMLEQEWFNMKVEYQLMEFEVTHFTINKKKRYYIRLGTWNSVSHKQRTPGEIWSALSSGSLRLPRTSTSLLSSTLAKAIGSLDVILPPFAKHLSTSSDCESVSSDEAEIDDGSGSEDNEKCTETSSVVASSVILPDASKFPLLRSLFSSNPGINVYDKLLNEIARFTDGPELNFKRGNNTEGTLVAIPAFRTLEKYKKNLKADSSILDVIVKAIARNSKCQSNEASEALLLAFYKSMKILFFLLLYSKEWPMESPSK